MFIRQNGSRETKSNEVKPARSERGDKMPVSKVARGRVHRSSSRGACLIGKAWGPPPHRSSHSRHSLAFSHRGHRGHSISRSGGATIDVGAGPIILSLPPVQVFKSK
jgi:hypothetical protein